MSLGVGNCGTVKLRGRIVDDSIPAAVVVVIRTLDRCTVVGVQGSTR